MAIRSKFSQLKEAIIQDAIALGLSKGSAIPSERALAENYDVSRVTVRRALGELVEEGVLQRSGKKTVLACSSTGYKPTHAVSEKRTITLMLTWIQDRFELEVVRGVETEARRLGYQIVITSSNDNPGRAARLIEETAEDVAGYIYLPVYCDDFEANNLRLIRQLQARNLPVVILDCHINGSGADTVVSDHFDGAYRATQHLIDQGHKHTAFIASRPCYAVDARIAGYSKCLADNGIHPDLGVVVQFQESIHSDHIEEAVDIILSHSPRITAVFAIYDLIAMKIYKQLKKSGVRVPEDIALVGYDNSFIYQDVEQFLTTTEQPLVEQGALACRMLVDRLNGFEGPPRFAVLKSELIVGRSTSTPGPFAAEAGNNR